MTEICGPKDRIDFLSILAQIDQLMDCKSSLIFTSKIFFLNLIFDQILEVVKNGFYPKNIFLPKSYFLADIFNF